MVVLKFQHTYKEILHNLEATAKFEFCSCVRLKSNTVRRQKRTSSSSADNVYSTELYFQQGVLFKSLLN